jgi:formamidopyrimidine-DNA glycosylase
LRQDIFSGIGNIISDEALWLAKIHPKTSIARLHGRDISKLYKNLKKVIKAILKQGGTSMRDWSHPDGKSGNYQEKFKIYRRKICPRCRTALARIVVGSRKSSVCPKCQRIRV